jgi:hypothetical protein
MVKKKGDKGGSDLERSSSSSLEEECEEAGTSGLLNEAAGIQPKGTRRMLQRNTGDLGSEDQDDQNAHPISSEEGNEDHEDHCVRGQGAQGSGGNGDVQMQAPAANTVALQKPALAGVKGSHRSFRTRSRKALNSPFEISGSDQAAFSTPEQGPYAPTFRNPSSVPSLVLLHSPICLVSAFDAFFLMHWPSSELSHMM